MPQVPAVAAPSQDALTAQIGALRAKSNELKLRLNDLAQRRVGLADASERQRTVQDRAALDKQISNVQHELASAQIQLESTNQQIQELQEQRDMARALSLGGPATIAMTAPPVDPFLGPSQIMTVLSGGFVLVLPFVLVLARRMWIRSVPRSAVDVENSPRLQRIEQAIESIAVEVERIGEAQRFTTKLLADRHSDAAARLGMVPRREPGTITPH